MSASVVLETSLSGLPVRRGKVRDVYDLGDRLLLVSTDRISAFDWVLPAGIPDKGRVLTQLSLFWFELLRDVVPNHVIASRVESYPEPLRRYADQLEGRSMIVAKTEPLPVECVVRGYLAGSGYKDYLRTGAVCGIPLVAGLRESEILGRMFPPAFAERNPDVIATRRSALAAVAPDCFARACLALAQLDLTPRLGAIRNRTLVLCGALDQTTPPALARALAAAIPGATYRDIPDSGHCQMLEQPDALVALLREFAG